MDSEKTWKQWRMGNNTIEMNHDFKTWLAEQYQQSGNLFDNWSDFEKATKLAWYYQQKRIDENKDKKLVAVLGGGDWNDASVDHLVCPSTMDLNKEKEMYNKWYRTYCDSMKGENKIEYQTFVEWLIKRGARQAEKEIEIFEDH